MWFFMYACYLLTAVSFTMLGVTGLQGYFKFYLFGVHHSSFALVSMVIYLFTQTLIMFFFVGTGVSVKEYSLEHKSDAAFYKRCIEIKNFLYLPMIINLVLMSAVFIIGGGVDTRAIAGWVHGLLFIVSYGHYARIIKIQHRAFRENTENMLELFGIKRPA